MLGSSKCFSPSALFSCSVPERGLTDVAVGMYEEAAQGTQGWEEEGVCEPLSIYLAADIV